MATNRNCVIRLSKYKNALYRLKNLGFVRVFSDNLADAVGVTSSQVRKDFSIFGITGKRRGGYKIDELIDSINNILGKSQVQNVIVVGVGNVGTALVKYKGFEQEGIKIVAGFDINVEKQSNKLDVPVFPLSKMETFIKKNSICIGILALPENATQEVLDKMVNAGIKGVLNFAPIRLTTPTDCFVNNVNLGLELETVLYFVTAQAKGSL